MESDEQDLPIILELILHMDYHCIAPICFDSWSGILIIEN